MNYSIPIVLITSMLYMMNFLSGIAYTDERFKTDLTSFTGQNYTFQEVNGTLVFETSNWCIFERCYNLGRNTKVVIANDITVYNKQFEGYYGYATWRYDGVQPVIYVNKQPTVNQTISILNHEMLHEWIFYNTLGSGHNLRLRFNEGMVNSRLNLLPVDYGSEDYSDITGTCELHSTCG